MDMSEVKCIFCSTQVNFHVGQLMSHLQEDHKLAERQTIFMALIIVDSESDNVLTDLLAKVDDRVKVLLEKHVERESLKETEFASSEEDLNEPANIDEIQKRIEDEFNSEDSDSDEDDSQVSMDDGDTSQDSVDDDDTTQDSMDDDATTEDSVDVDGASENPTQEEDEFEISPPNVVIKSEVVEDSETSPNENSDPRENVNIAEHFLTNNMCKLCYASFNDKDHLREHEELEHEDDAESLQRTSFTLKDLKFSCPKCSVKYLTANLLRKHQEKQHQMTRMVTCRICKISITPDNVNFHMAKHKSVSIQCQLCYKNFKNTQSKLIHCERAHQDEAEFLNREISEADLAFGCDKCEFKFVSQNLLTSHQNHSHTEEQNYYNIKTKTYNCVLCHSQARTSQELKSHLRKNHSSDLHLLGNIKEEDFTVPCNICDLKFFKETLVDFHRTRVHFPHAKKVPCDRCDKEIVRYNYSLHKSTHNTEKNFSCLLCNLKLKTKSTLKQHQMSKHVTAEEKDFFDKGGDVSLLKYNCSKCDKKFLSERLLGLHSQEHTKNLKRCNICYKVMRDRYVLERHQKDVHKDEEEFWNKEIPAEKLKYSCDDCQLKFLSESLLKKHETVHNQHQFGDLKKSSYDSSTKRFKCKLCLVSYKQVYNLGSHIATVHQTAEEKDFLANGGDVSKLKYNCSKCEKKFLSESLLGLHFQKHTKNLKQCNICYKVLKDRYVLERHQKIFHKAEEEFWNKEIPEEKLKYSCGICQLKFLSESVLKCHSSSHREKVCHICFKKRSRINMRAHMEKMHKSEEEYWFKEIPQEKLLYGCNKCEKKFVSENVLKVHSKAHLSQDFEKLKTECFNDKSKTYSCKLCHKNFNDFYRMMNHMSRIHKSLKELWSRKIESHELKYQCLRCDVKCFNQELLQMHQIVHTQHQFGDLKKTAFDSSTRKFKCKLCLVSWKQVYNLASHISTVHQADAELFKKDLKEEDLVHECDETNCNKKFPSEPSLEYHRKLHTVKRVKRVKSKKLKVKVESRERFCQLCHITYKRPHSLKSHKMKVHSMELDAFEREVTSEDLKYPCSRCSRVFLTENTLNHHMNVKHYKGYKVSVCKLCDIDFKNPLKFNRHRYKVHKDELWAFKTEIHEDALVHQCHCGKKFPTPSSLDFHKGSIHQELKKKLATPDSKVGMKSVKCPLCYEPFKKSFYLSAHMKKHQPEERALLAGQEIQENMLKYPCELCDLRFVSTNTLRFHTRKRHVQRETFCRLCYVQFRDTAKFQAHKKNIHKTAEELNALKTKVESQDLRFSCRYCDKKFLTSNVLKYHNTYSHKEEKRRDINCEYCGQVFKYSPNRKSNLENHVRRIHNLESGESQESQEAHPSQNDTVQNFLSFFNSLSS